jgi:glycosyltransferase involved in cell wall biosynthesis
MTHHDPLVTVYIPCRNYGRYLSMAIESIIGQLYKNWEMIIIDEASDDNTQVVSNYFQNIYPDQIMVIRNDEAIGLQKVANLVLSIAKGKYLMRLDADDWLDEAALLVMVAKLESNLEFGLVYGNYYYTDEFGQVLGIERRPKLGEENASCHLPPHGACTLVSMRALKTVGGYSEDVNAQDGWELWFKLLNRVSSVQLDVPVFYYRQHQQSLSRNFDRLLNARTEIFRKARESLNGSYQPSCLAVIPVRESYPDWDGVPYEMINGKTLLELALESALGARGVTEVVVSSESQAVLNFSKTLEDRLQLKHLRLLRPHGVENVSLKPQAILEHAVEKFKEERGWFPDILIFLSIHAPLRQSVNIDKAIDILILTMSDSVVSVNQEREPMFRHGKRGLELLNPGRFEGLAYEREHLYRFNGAIIGLWSSNLLEGEFFGHSIGYLEMSDSSSIQVKQKADLEHPLFLS